MNSILWTSHLSLNWVNNPLQLIHIQTQQQFLPQGPLWTEAHGVLAAASHCCEMRGSSPNMCNHMGWFGTGFISVWNFSEWGANSKSIRKNVKVETRYRAEIFLWGRENKLLLLLLLKENACSKNSIFVCSVSFTSFIKCLYDIRLCLHACHAWSVTDCYYSVLVASQCFTFCSSPCILTAWIVLHYFSGFHKSLLPGLI